MKKKILVFLVFAGFLLAEGLNVNSASADICGTCNGTKSDFTGCFPCGSDGTLEAGYIDDGNWGTTFNSLPPGESSSPWFCMSPDLAGGSVRNICKATKSGTVSAPAPAPASPTETCCGPSTYSAWPNTTSGLCGTVSTGKCELVPTTYTFPSNSSSANWKCKWPLSTYEETCSATKTATPPVAATYDCGTLPANSEASSAYEETGLTTNGNWIYGYPNTEKKCEFKCVAGKVINDNKSACVDESSAPVDITDKCLKKGIVTAYDLDKTPPPTPAWDHCETGGQPSQGLGDTVVEYFCDDDNILKITRTSCAGTTKCVRILSDDNGTIECVESPTISSFTVNPSTPIASGGSATFSWIVSGATSCKINGIPVSFVEPFNYTFEAIAKDTTYILTCENNSGGLVNSEPIVVTVNTPPSSEKCTGTPPPDGASYCSMGEASGPGAWLNVGDASKCTSERRCEYYMPSSPIAKPTAVIATATNTRLEGIGTASAGKKIIMTQWFKDGCGGTGTKIWNDYIVNSPITPYVDTRSFGTIFTETTDVYFRVQEEGGAWSDCASATVTVNTPPSSEKCTGTPPPDGASYCSMGEASGPGAWLNVGDASKCTSERRCEYYMPSSPPLVNLCGPAGSNDQSKPKTYEWTVGKFSDELCINNEPSPIPDFPLMGELISWTCKNESGTESQTCYAKRNSNNIIPKCIGNIADKTATLCPGDDTDLKVDTEKIEVSSCTHQRKCEYIKLATNCQNFPPPSFCPGGTKDIIVTGKDNNDCPLYGCKNTSAVVACGTANKKFYEATDMNFKNDTFCTSGIASPLTPIFPKEGNIVEWKCSESGNWITDTLLLRKVVSCASARKNKEVVFGCGDASGVYDENQTSFRSENFCADGFNLSSVKPTFPTTAGTTVDWVCRPSFFGAIFTDKQPVVCSAIGGHTGSSLTASIGTGDGLLAKYFNNHNFTAQQVTQIDPVINFNWGLGKPNSAIEADTFSIRWTGQVQPKYDGEWTFHVTADDGVRLWVNDQLLVDKWIDQVGTEYASKITLNAGQKYNIKMEYYENGGYTVAQLAWSHTKQGEEIIPQTQLYSN